jgi:hypothetical protein
MNILKIIFFNLASLSIAISITSCQNNSVNEPYVSKFDRSSSSPVQSSSPVVYDVICFPQSGLLTTGVSCQPENIFKVPRGTKVTAYLQTVTSVQQGSNINTSFTTDTKSDEEKISVSEMESLSLKDAKIYVVTREVGGRFDIFAQGEFQKLGEDTSRVNASK